MYLILGFVLFALLILLSKKESKRHRRYYNNAIRVYEKLLSFENNGQKINYLKKINPYVFEELILYSLKKKGLNVVRNKKYSGDGGIDGKFYYENHKYYVQAKRYENHINKGDVVKFENLVRTDKVKGIFCHTGLTGKGSKEEFLNSPFITCYSGTRLIELLFNEDLSCITGIGNLRVDPNDRQEVRKVSLKRSESILS